VAFIAFVTAIFSKKTTQSLGLPKKTS